MNTTADLTISPRAYKFPFGEHNVEDLASAFVEQARNSTRMYPAMVTEPFSREALITLCRGLIESISLAIGYMGAKIHDMYLEKNAYILTEAPHLACAFADLPLEEQIKDLEIASMYYGSHLNKEMFADRVASAYHGKWLEKYRAQHGSTPRIRNGIRIDLPWSELPAQKRAGDAETMASYYDIFVGLRSQIRWALHADAENMHTIRGVFPFVLFTPTHTIVRHILYSLCGTSGEDIVAA